MSSSTEITFSFAFMTSLEVVIGASAVSDYLGVAANKEKVFEGKEAVDLMRNSNIVGAMPSFDQAIVTLLLERASQHELERRFYANLAGNDRPEDSYLGTYLKVRHVR